MNSENDLILGVLGGTWCGFQYPGIEAYVESIKRSGFAGRKVMLVWGIRPEVREKLLEYDFELVDVPQPYDAFFHARMRVSWEYLKDHHKEFRYIFWLDIKDLILQSDPSVWMEKNIGHHSIIASTECVTIEQEETNQLWLRHIVGEKEYQEVKDEEVINCGTWAGTSEAMTEVFHQTHLGCQKYSGGYPPCQANLNYVLHTIFKKDRHIPRWSEGFAACLHPCWSPWRVPCWPHMRDAHPVLDLSTCTLHAGTKPNSENPMVVFNSRWGTDRHLQITAPSFPLEGLECVEKPKGKAFSIVHGWDRDWDVKYLFEFRYRFGGGFDMVEFKRWNEELASRQPIQPRGLRRPRIENSYSGRIVPQSSRVFSRHT
jgi:hypothetical protein